MGSREDNIYYARLAEQGERYEDMIRYMKLVATVFLLSYCVVGQSAFERRTQPPVCRLQKLSWQSQSCLADDQCNSRQRRIQRL